MNEIQKNVPYFPKFINYNFSNHDLHHELGKKINLGFYFTFWDRLMGTFKTNTD